MSRPGAPRRRRSERVRLAGEAWLRWRCRRCDVLNLRPLDGLPWRCHECGRDDRDVEAEAAEEYRREEARR